MKTILTKHQVKEITKDLKDGDDNIQITVIIRYDDNFNNGHNSFSITADIYKNMRFYCGGYCHQEITKYTPELKKYIKWHMMTSEGPLYYIENTTYLAGDKDYNGLRKGEVSSYKKAIKFGKFYILQRGFTDKFISMITSNSRDLTIVELKNKNSDIYSPKYSFKGMGHTEWYKGEFDTIEEAKNFRSACIKYKIEIIETPHLYSKGKEPDLEGARKSAIWEDSTLEQLTNKELLKERLPKLMKEFQKDIKELGFIF